MSFSIVIENIHKIRSTGTVISGKIEKCDENITIQDGQPLNIFISEEYYKGLYPVYGHKTRLLKTNEYFSICIPSKFIPYQIGDSVNITV